MAGQLNDEQFLVALQLPNGLLYDDLVTFHRTLADAVAERDSTTDIDELRMMRVFRVVPVPDGELQQVREQEGQT